eukprot:Rmarinus@m.5842
MKKFGGKFKLRSSSETSNEGGGPERKLGSSRSEAQEVVVTAIREATIERIKYLFEQEGYDVRAEDTEHQQTYMHTAAHHGRQDVIELLISWNLEVDCRDKEKLTPLHYAAASNHVLAVCSLVRNGASPHSTDARGLTPMHFAATYGHVRVIEVLRDALADVSPRDQEGSTPMHFAAANGHTEALERLVELGAIIDSPNHVGRTPLHSATINSHVHVIKKLLQLGAAPTTADGSGNTPLELCKEKATREALTSFITESQRTASKDPDLDYSLESPQLREYRRTQFHTARTPRSPSTPTRTPSDPIPLYMDAVSSTTTVGYEQRSTPIRSQSGPVKSYGKSSPSHSPFMASRGIMKSPPHSPADHNLSEPRTPRSPTQSADLTSAGSPTFATATVSLEIVDEERQKNAELQEQLAKANERIAELESQVVQAEAREKAARSDHENDVLRLQKKVSSLEASIAAASQDKAEAVKHVQEELDALAASHAKLQNAHEGLRGQHSDLRLRYETFESILVRKDEEVEAVKERYEKVSSLRRRLQEEISDLKGNIRVFCRVRPYIEREEEERIEPAITHAADTLIQASNPEITRGRAKSTKEFEFDCVFGTESTQDDIYKEAAPLMHSVVDGYNVCMFAYGQTGSGKTYTMEGPEHDPGVNPRALGDLFRIMKARDDWEFEVRASLLEIYNETLRDLIADAVNQDEAPLKIRENEQGGIFIQNLTWQSVSSSDDLKQLVRRGCDLRATASTNMNDRSSRSHLMLSVEIVGAHVSNGLRTRGKLNLIDLAGSERVWKSGATGSTLKEAQNINLSLSALGDVISALQNKSSHIPFRNSKLTHILSDSLGGRSKVVMVACVAPGVDNASETFCTLAFALRASNVSLGAAKRTLDVSGADIAKLKKQLDELTSRLRAKEDEAEKFAQELRKARTGQKSSDENTVALNKRLKLLEEQLVHKERELQEANNALRNAVATIAKQSKAADVGTRPPPGAAARLRSPTLSPSPGPSTPLPLASSRSSASASAASASRPPSAGRASLSGSRPSSSPSRAARTSIASPGRTRSISATTPKSPKETSSHVSSSGAGAGIASKYLSPSPSRGRALSSSAARPPSASTASKRKPSPSRVGRTSSPRSPSPSPSPSQVLRTAHSSSHSPHSQHTSPHINSHASSAPPPVLSTSPSLPPSGPPQPRRASNDMSDMSVDEAVHAAISVAAATAAEMDPVTGGPRKNSARPVSPKTMSRAPLQSPLRRPNNKEGSRSGGLLVETEPRKRTDSTGSLARVTDSEPSSVGSPRDDDAPDNADVSPTGRRLPRGSSRRSIAFFGSCQESVPRDILVNFVGHMCEICDSGGEVREGTVRYVGEIDDSGGTWVGVELSQPLGKNDGSAKGKRYFTCAPQCGLFVRPSRITLCPTSSAPLGDFLARELTHNSPLHSSNGNNVSHNINSPLQPPPVETSASPGPTGGKESGPCLAALDVVKLGGGPVMSV